MSASPSSIQARLRLACIVTVLIFCIRHARGQATALKPTIRPPAGVQAVEPSSTPAYKPIGDSDLIEVNLPNVPVQAVIPFYQDLTGRKLILDSNLQGNQLRITSPHKLTRREAIAYVESSLLLNGYMFVHMDATTSKLINVGASANVPANGLSVYSSLTELPINEEICHFVLPLQYVTASDASKAFMEVIKPHTYGAMMPVANDTALLITENSTTIRSIVRIAQIIDVPPAQTSNETIKLQRADVEIVAEIINEIFEQDEESNATPQAAAPPAAVPATPGMARPGLPAGTATPVNTATSLGGSSANRGSMKVKVIPYRRTNELIVIARPVDIAYIRSLVEKLDKQDDGDTFRKFRLNYLSVADFLDSARDTLARDTDIQSESGGASSGGGRRSGRTRESTGVNNDALTDSGRNSSGNNFNSGGFNGGFNNGTGGNNGNLNRSLLDEPEMVGAPESIIVGKTLLIADPQSNSLIVSGSPEHIQRIEQLLSEMDVRPQQIYISAIIGQLNLGTEFNYGFDFLRLLTDFSVRDAASAVGAAGGAAGAVASTGSISFPANFKEFAYNKLNFYGQIGSLGNYIKLIDGNKNFKVLATPSVYAKNAAKSVISSGQRIAVPASILSNGAFAGGVASNSVSVEYRDVVLKLEVVPLINSDNEVTLKIAQINDNIVGTQTISGNTVPTIGTQQLVTEVAVKDGAAVVLGGLITERVNDSARGGIFLRRIPVLKHLFGATEKTSTREELLIFIQPHIIKSTDNLDGPNRIERGRSNLYEEAREFSSPELRDIPRALPYDGR